jgi:uncharacterized protein (TIGR00730 family)
MEDIMTPDEKKNDYEINQLAKDESWRLFRIMGELVEGFDSLSGVEPAVSIYGSARIKAGDKSYNDTYEIAHRLGKLGFSIITGGGPGVMEAANKGAAEAGVTSVGINIEIPDAQPCNIFATRTLTFHHFFVRKIMLVKYATAFVIVPGGLGTLDELTEVLTLMQTRKIKPFPIVLYDSEYWSGFLSWLRHFSLARGYVSEEDFDLLRLADSPQDAVDIVQQWYMKQEIAGKQAILEDSD